MIEIKTNQKPANREIRVFDKKTKKAKVISLYTEMTIEDLRDFILIKLQELK